MTESETAILRRELASTIDRGSKLEKDTDLKKKMQEAKDHPL